MVFQSKEVTIILMKTYHKLMTICHEERLALYLEAVSALAENLNH